MYILISNRLCILYKLFKESIQTEEEEPIIYLTSRYPAFGQRAMNCEQLSVEHYINIYYNILNNTLQDTSGVGSSAVLETSTSVATTFEWNSDIREFVFCCRQNNGYRKLGVFGFVLFFIIVIHLGILFIVQVFWQISLTRLFY